MQHYKEHTFELEGRTIAPPYIMTQGKVVVLVGRQYVECKAATNSYGDALEVFLHGKKVLCRYSLLTGWTTNPIKKTIRVVDKKTEKGTFLVKKSKKSKFQQRLEKIIQREIV